MTVSPLSRAARLLTVADTGRASSGRRNRTRAARGPREARVRFRLPEDARPVSATVNNRAARLSGDTVMIDARAGGRFDVVVRTR